MQPMCRHEGLNRREAKHAGLGRQAFKQEGILLLGSEDGQVHLCGNVQGSPYMINVTVCEQYLVQADAMALHFLHKQLGISSRIYQGGLARGFATHERAILLIGCDRDDS